jgi:hypothetical protein
VQTMCTLWSGSVLSMVRLSPTRIVPIICITCLSPADRPVADRMLDAFAMSIPIRLFMQAHMAAHAKHFQIAFLVVVVVEVLVMDAEILSAPTARTGFLFQYFAVWPARASSLPQVMLVATNSGSALLNHFWRLLLPFPVPRWCITATLYGQSCSFLWTTHWFASLSQSGYNGDRLDVAGLGDFPAGQARSVHLDHVFYWREFSWWHSSYSIAYIGA